MNSCLFRCAKMQTNLNLECLRPPDQQSAVVIFLFTVIGLFQILSIFTAKSSAVHAILYPSNVLWVYQSFPLKNSCQLWLKITLMRTKRESQNSKGTGCKMKTMSYKMPQIFKALLGNAETGNNYPWVCHDKHPFSHKNSHTLISYNIKITDK